MTFCGAFWHTVENFNITSFFYNHPFQKQTRLISTVMTVYTYAKIYQNLLRKN